MADLVQHKAKVDKSPEKLFEIIQRNILKELSEEEKERAIQIASQVLEKYKKAISKDFD